jgi:hypothetical protein
LFSPLGVFHSVMDSHLPQGYSGARNASSFETQREAIEWLASGTSTTRRRLITGAQLKARAATSP